jgi:hypothetical protein
MKFRITMKDPDGPYECIQDAAEEMVEAIEGLTPEERQVFRHSRVDMLRDFAGRWMEYGEYITVEFDTEAGTATVIESKN